jgi:hypothetical protein
LSSRSSSTITLCMMHNITIECERASLVHGDHSYDCQGALAEIDYQVSDGFGASLAIHHEISDERVH